MTTIFIIIFVIILTLMILLGIPLRYFMNKEQPMTQDQDALIYLALEAMTKKNIQEMETK